MPQNFRGKSHPATIRKHHDISTILSHQSEGLTVSELAASMGIASPLALYHLKKMAAAGLIVLCMEPCRRNGGLRFRCWDEVQLAGYYRGWARRAA